MKPKNIKKLKTVVQGLWVSGFILVIFAVILFFTGASDQVFTIPLLLGVILGIASMLAFLVELFRKR
jgi:hypothetical protein